MADVVSNIASSAGARLSQQPPALPAKKQVDVPDVEHVATLCCPPEMVLLDHFRVQRQQVLEVREKLVTAAKGGLQLGGLRMLLMFHTVP
jgi:hypothetical protein